MGTKAKGHQVTLEGHWGGWQGSSVVVQGGIYLPWCLRTEMGETLHLLQSRPQKRDNLGEKEPVPKGNSAWLHQGRVGEPGLVLVQKSSGVVPTLCCQQAGEGDGEGKMLRVSRRCWHRAGINGSPAPHGHLCLCAPILCSSGAFPAPGRKPHEHFLPQRQNHTDTHGKVLLFGSTNFYFINCHSKPRKPGPASPAFPP